MDVRVPEVPASYDEYRRRVRDFVAANKPVLHMKQKAGLRVPDDPEDVAKLRRWVRALHDAGFASPQHTLTPLDPQQMRVLSEELGRAGVPVVLGNPLVGGAIKLFGTDDQKLTYLPAIASGEHIWTQLFSEPAAGSDLASLQTRGELQGDYYVVTGQKVWSTWAQFSDYGYLLVRTENKPGPGGITAFILDMKSPGVTTRPLREITGTTDFNEVFLDKVRIPVANVIGQPGQGWAVTNASLAQERGGIGGGGSEDSIAGLVRIARQATRAGRPALEDGAVRQAIGRFAARSRIQRALGYRVATKAAAKEIGPADAPIGKIWFSELNLEINEYAMELQGPNGALVEGDPLAHQDGKYQDAFLYARAWTIAGGSNEIMRNIISERALGLPREARG
jgi:alkylation response protein AidB-like acyl-CoA dehydrogenase